MNANTVPRLLRDEGLLEFRRGLRFFAEFGLDPLRPAGSLLSFLRYYNRKRPHSSLGDQPPISRIHNLCGQDS